MPLLLLECEPATYTRLPRAKLASMSISSSLLQLSRPERPGAVQAAASARPRAVLSSISGLMGSPPAGP